jgi:hypothetical protein
MKVKLKFKEMEAFIKHHCPQSPARAQALNRLKESRMWTGESLSLK